MLDNPEEGTDENSEEQTADTPDPMEAEGVEVDTAEVEASETPDAEERLLISSEENIETLDVTAENDDLDPESE